MDGAAFGVSTEHLAGLAATLGSGLLIGLERERHKQRGPRREPAGLRTFTLAAMGGALAQVLALPGLVAVVAVAVTALGGLAYARTPGRDPGPTRALALLVTCLIGALCVTAPLLGGLLCGGLGALLARRSHQLERDAAPTAAVAGRNGPLRLREALLLSLMLSAVAVGVSWAREHFGNSGLYGAVALAAFADVHAPIASLAGLRAAGTFASGQLLAGLLLAFACNSVTRSITAAVAGGWRFARFVVPALALPLLLGGSLAAQLR